MSKDDTCAFPQLYTTPGPYGSGKINHEGGMTLRDYFAAKALQGLVACPGDAPAENYALVSYRLADAMLKERTRHDREDT